MDPVTGKDSGPPRWLKLSGAGHLNPVHAWYMEEKIHKLQTCYEKNMHSKVIKIAIFMGLIGIMLNLIIGFMLWGSTSSIPPTTLSSVLIYGILALIIVEIIGLYFIGKHKMAGPVLFFISGILLILFGFLLHYPVSNTFSYATPTTLSTITIHVNIFLFLLNAIILFVSGILAWSGRDKRIPDTGTRFRVQLDEIMRQ